MTVHFDNVPARAVAAARLDYSQDSSGGIYRRLGKRLFDLAFVVLTSPVTLPVIALMALLVASRGGSPFYSQLRIGRDGSVFRLWKLRTMVPNADEILNDFLAQNPAAREEWEATQKLRHDPRVTPIGKFLRRASIDELPQFFNILMGDMSVVGPRPMMQSQECMYFGRAYYRLLPGVTGPWQVSDRNDCAFVDRVIFDEAYDRELSLSLDLRLVGRTVLTVMRCTGH
ncbi:MAG: sugar transferase [Pseudomonadota bacterium]